MSWKPVFNNINRRKDDISGNNDRFENNREESHSSNHPARIHYLRFLLKRIWSDRKLRILFILSLFVFKALIFLAVVFLVPAIDGLIDLIHQ